MLQSGNHGHENCTVCLSVCLSVVYVYARSLCSCACVRAHSCAYMCARCLCVQSMPSE